MSRADKKYNNKQEAFVCAKCGKGVLPDAYGTLNRNHCPECLWSRHVDVCTGDRLSVCRGMMEPVGIWVKGDNEWSLIHRCIKCGFIRANRIAGDDSHIMLTNLALRPVNMPPFQLENSCSDEKICSLKEVK